MQRLSVPVRERFGLTAILLLLLSCGSPSETEIAVEMPFDPAGTWAAPVEGVLHDSTYGGTLSLQMELMGEPYRPPHNEYLLVELWGTWMWGDLSGQVHGFWTAGPETDAQARDSDGDCPEYYTVCSLNLTLETPVTDVCGEQAGLGGLAPIWLQGWFGGSDEMTAAELSGTYWVGKPGEGPTWTSCGGPVLISLDTTVTFRRR